MTLLYYVLGSVFNWRTNYLAARMESLMDIFKPFAVNVGIYLGSRDVGMTKHELD